MNLKGRFPFRLGTTSYIIPDDILPNVRYLASRVDDIELVLFESDEISNIPDAATVRTLKSLADDHGLTYTVHLPMDTWLGHADEGVRRESVGKCLRIVRRMGALDPFAYVVHFHGDRRGPIPTDDLPRWLENHRRSMNELCAEANGVPLCVETLEYPFELIEGLCLEEGWPLCLDVGHMLLTGQSVEGYLSRRLERTGVVHLHGIRDGRDHQDLRGLDPALLAALLANLSAGRDRVVTLEIFGEEDLRQSIEVLRRFLPCPQ